MFLILLHIKYFQEINYIEQSNGYKAQCFSIQLKKIFIYFGSKVLELTFVLIGYRMLTNCSKLQHSEMTGNPVTDYSHLGKILATTKNITYFPSLRCALYSHELHQGIPKGV